MAEYADSGTPYYWLIWLSGDHVLSIDVPVRIDINWTRLTDLVRT